jgi:uncharacterized protein (TIRG00374 family)
VSRALQIFLAILISAIAVWFSVRGVDLAESLAVLREVRLIWLVPMIFFAVLALWLRAVRWRYILETVGPVGDTPVFYATCIGFMGNMVLPLRAGEAIKPLVVSRTGPIGFPSAVATVVLERLCDMMMLGLFALFTVPMVPAGDVMQGRGTSVAVIVGVVVLAIALIARRAALIERWLIAISTRLPEMIGRAVREGGQGLLHGLTKLGQPKTFGIVFVTSALVWLAAVAGFATGALALGIDAPLIPLGFATTVIVAVAVSVPSAPGFIGVFWAGSEIALELFGVPKSLGFSFGVLNWIVQMIVIVALGMWALTRLNLSLREVSAAGAASEAG